MLTFYKQLAKLVEDNKSFVLATIIDRKGSAPRSVGASMAIFQDKSIIGTIGGGALEGQVQHFAPTLWHQRQSVIKEFKMTSPHAKERDMICGGVVEVLLHFIDANNNQTKTLFSQLLAGLQSNKKTTLFYPLPNNENGDLILTSGNPSTLCDIPSIDKSQYWSQTIVVYPKAYIFGAGHVGQQLATILPFVHFDVTVIDDRPEYANPDILPPEVTVQAIQSLENLLDEVTIESESYIIIVTRGHLFDMAVLRQALTTQAYYVGMIGSQRKKQVIFNALLEDGVPQQQLDSVHCPIGLSIGAETPEEIAVSIAAEMIAIRSKKVAIP